MKKPDYPIRAVAKLTGLSIDTLRAWERRYQAVLPQRQGKGRTYSEADVQKLRLLRELVERGYSIGQIAALSQKELQEIAGKSEKLAGLVEAEPRRQGGRAAPVSARLQAIEAAIERFDYFDADLELSRLAALLSVRELVHRVVIPLMQRVGDRWHNGELSIAQEHMTSAILRNLLGALVRLYARENPAQTLLFTTPGDEGHEFGILSAAMLAAGGGLGIIYLGAALPAEEILQATRRTAANVVVLGIKGTGEPQRAIKELRAVLAGLSPKVELWVGGATTDALAEQIKTTGAIFIPDFQVLERHLLRLGARF